MGLTDESGLNETGKKVAKILSDRRHETPGAKYQLKQTESPEFKKWFGNSKVVDENGEPLVVYHGSPEKFNVFSYENVGAQGTTEGYGFYFTPDKNIAKGYAEKRGEGELFEIYLKIENPASNEKRGLILILLNCNRQE